MTSECGTDHGQAALADGIPVALRTRVPVAVPQFGVAKHKVRQGCRGLHGFAHERKLPINIVDAMAKLWKEVQGKGPPEGVAVGHRAGLPAHTCSPTKAAHIQK